MPSSPRRRSNSFHVSRWAARVDAPKCGCAPFAALDWCAEPASGKILILKQVSRFNVVSADVEPLYLFSLASADARWLTIRQTAVSQNVANANTPGYKAQEVAPFSSIYESAGLQMAATQPDHLSPDLIDLASTAGKGAEPWETTLSGNSVSLEQEMLSANEINRNYSMNTAIVKSFNQMLAMSLKAS
ncbi:MAG TPA: flagellar basal body rod protein FlgB [Methylovirgula sp.]